MTKILDLKTLLQAEASLKLIPSEWQLQAVSSEECFAYIAWNAKTKEAIALDPKTDDRAAYSEIARALNGFRWIAVIDTHTHADHISFAADLAQELKAPLIMHEKALSPRVDLRVSRTTKLATQAGPLTLVCTPGHTPDSLTPIWGPFVFGGDTLLFNDVGRDDLPGGDAEAHYESVQSLKAILELNQIILPGHDHKGGRASTWGEQLSTNTSLTQSREDFVREAIAFDGASPKLLKQSLRENFK